MATIYDAIRGEVQTSDQYLADDPYYKASQLAQQYVQPQTSSQAIWGPMVQALVGGVLNGIGKRNAREKEFDAYKASGLQDAMAAQLTGTEGTEGFGPVASGDVYGKNIPILNSVYMQEDAPKGWTGATGKKDLLKALLQQEAVAEEAKYERDSARKLAEVLAQKTALGPIEAANARLLKEQEALASQPGRTALSPELAGINALPEKMQGPALKELEETKKFNEAIPEIRGMMQEAHKASQKLKGLKGVWPLQDISMTDEQTTRDAISAQIFGKISGIVPGVLTDQDAKRTVDKFIPTYWDSAEAAQKKTEGLLSFIQSKVSSAPILEGAGIAKREAISAPPATSKPLSAEQLAQAQVLKARGMSKEQIAKELGL